VSPMRAPGSSSPSSRPTTGGAGQAGRVGQATTAPLTARVRSGEVSPSSLRLFARALTLTVAAAGALLWANFEAPMTGTAAAAAAGPPLVVTTTSLPAVEVGEPLSIQLDASGGATPYQWVPDSLPAGVTITSGGLLGGAATSTSSQGVEVSVVDAANQRVTTTVALVVAPGPLLTTPSLPPAQVGKAYSLQLGEANGTAPFSWSIGKGGIPGGLVLSSSGLLSGRPGTSGTSTVDIEVTDGLGATSQALLSLSVQPAPLPAESYVTADAAGRSVSVGMAAPSSSKRLAGKAVALAPESSGAGYWTLTSAGRIHAFGGARNYGSVSRKHLEGQAVGVAPAPDDSGYWVVISTGHVYGFGSARSLGSVPKRSRRVRIVGIAATTGGLGYWLVSNTGRVYAFGAAASLGSVPSRALHGRIVAIASATTVQGYFVVSSTGRIYGFGGARPLAPSAGRVTGNVVAIAVAPAAAGAGYWLLTRVGAVYAFGRARELATSPPQPLSKAVTGVPAVAIAAGP
jgi:hypothetical protein